MARVRVDDALLDGLNECVAAAGSRVREATRRVDERAVARLGERERLRDVAALVRVVERERAARRQILVYKCAGLQAVRVKRSFLYSRKDDGYPCIKECDARNSLCTGGLT